jgi:hypothetical protein
LFIQKPLFLASLNAYKGSSLNLLIGGLSKKPDPAALAALQATGTLPTPAQSAAATTQLLSDGSGDYHPTVTAEATQLDAYLLQGFE